PAPTFFPASPAPPEVAPAVPDWAPPAPAVAPSLELLSLQLRGVERMAHATNHVSDRTIDAILRYDDGGLYLICRCALPPSRKHPRIVELPSPSRKIFASRGAA